MMNERNTRFHFLYILLKVLAVINWDKEAELLIRQYKQSLVHFLSAVQLSIKYLTVKTAAIVWGGPLY